MRTDGALYDYALALKGRFMRSAPPLAKVAYDNRLHVIHERAWVHWSRRSRGSRATS